MAPEIEGATPLERLAFCLEHPPHNAWIGAKALSVDEDRREIVVEMAVRPEFSLDRTTLVVHGGVLASLIDITGHASVAVWHGYVTPTIGLQVEYLAPAAGEVLIARGILRKLGRSIARADIEVSAGDRLVALGRGTFSTR